MQKRLCDIGWSDDEKCRGCSKEEGTDKHRLYHCPSWNESQNPDPRGFGEVRTMGQTVERRLEVAKRNYVAPTERKQLEDKSTCRSTGGNRKSTKVGACQLKAPPMARCWESWSVGERADCQWCSLTTTRRWGQWNAGCRA